MTFKRVLFLSPFWFFSLITRGIPKEVAEVDFWKKALFPMAVPFLHLNIHIMKGFDNRYCVDVTYIVTYIVSYLGIHLIEGTIHPNAFVSPCSTLKTK